MIERDVRCTHCRRVAQLNEDRLCLVCEDYLSERETA